MPQHPNGAAILFPGALGDFICFLPTLAALRERHAGQLLLVSKPQLGELIAMRELTMASIDRREISDLFAAGPIAPATRALLGGFASVYSWTGCGNADFESRLTAVTRGEVNVFAFRGMSPGQHAADYYARCVAVLARPLSAECIRHDKEWWAAFTQEHVSRRLFVLHPGSGSPSKNWQGFAQLAHRWCERHPQDSVVVLSGPAEAFGESYAEPGVIVLDGLSLPQAAALLRGCVLYVGNDSGISHLAAAVGARGVVLFGPSDPAVWGPRGDRMRVIHAPAPCPDCPAGTFCAHRLPIDSVVRALETLSVQV